MLLEDLLAPITLIWNRFQRSSTELSLLLESKDKSVANSYRSISNSWESCRVKKSSSKQRILSIQDSPPSFKLRVLVAPSATFAGQQTELTRRHARICKNGLPNFDV